jgi:hypothetical protein
MVAWAIVATKIAASITSPPGRTAAVRPAASPSARNSRRRPVRLVTRAASASMVQAKKQAKGMSLVFTNAWP